MPHRHRMQSRLLAALMQLLLRNPLPVLLRRTRERPILMKDIMR